MSLSADLDTWAAGIATATSMTVTRDPDLIHPPCVFLGIPDISAITLDGVTIEQPVWLVAANSGKPAADSLVDNIATLLAAIDSKTATDTTLTVGGIEYHTYSTTARLHITI